jgi:hypothetical protein
MFIYHYMNIQLVYLCALFGYIRSGVPVLFSICRRYKLYKIYLREQSLYFTPLNILNATLSNRQEIEPMTVFNILFTIL